MSEGKKMKLVIMAILSLWVAFKAAPMPAADDGAGAARCGLEEDGLVAYWKFDELLGDVAADNSGNGHEGRLIGGVSRDQGVSGGAVRLNGVDGYIACRSGVGMDELGTAYTVSLWVKYCGSGPEKKANWSLIAKNSGGNGAQDPFHLWVCADAWRSGGVRAFGGRISNGKVEYSVFQGRRLDDGAFHHVAMTYDDSDRRWRLWVDGIVSSEAEMVSGWRPFANSSALTIGVWKPYGNFFNGMIDEVKIYNRALSSFDLNGQYIAGLRSLAQRVVGGDSAVLSLPMIPGKCPDGRIDAGEWNEGISLAGFLDDAGFYADKQSEVFFAGCDSGVRVMVRSDIWSDSLQSSAGSPIGGSIELDDFIEVRCWAEGAVAPTRRWLINPAGVVFRGGMPGDGGLQRVADGMGAISRVDKGRWEVKMLLPWSDLGAVSGSILDRQLRVDVVRSFAVPRINSLDVGRQRVVRTSLFASGRNGSGCIPLLISPEGSPGIRMDSFRGFESGRIDSAVFLANSPGGALRCRWGMLFGGAVESVHEKEMNDPRSSLQLSGDLPVGDESRVGSFFIGVVDGGGKICYWRFIPFACGGAIFDISVDVHRELGAVFVDVDKRIARSFDGRRVRVELTDAHGGLLQCRDLSGVDIELDRIRIRFELGSIPNLTPLIFRVALLDGDRVAYQKAIPFEKMEDCHSANNAIGDGDDVPAPWDGLTYDGERSVAFGNRRYVFGDGDSLIDDVFVGCESLLAEPIRLRVSSRGNGGSWLFLSREIAKRSSSEFEVVSRYRIDPALDVAVHRKAEFDGMVRFDVDLIPCGKVEVNEFSLRIPVRSAVGDLFFASQGEDADRQVKPFSDIVQRIGRIPCEWSSHFLPSLWIGDRSRGICWFAEDDRHWINGDLTKQLSLHRTSEAVYLRAAMIDRPIDLTSPLRFTFGLQVTPVRSPVSDWRRRSEWGGFAAKANGSLVTGGRSLWKHDALVFNPEAVRSQLSSLRKIGFLDILPYYFPENCETGPLEVMYYYRDWASKITADGIRLLPGAMVHSEERMCFLSVAARSYQNFLLYHYDDQMKKYGFSGIYFDGNYPLMVDNPAIVGSVLRADGSTVSTYPLFSIREFYKRVYRMIKSHGDDKIVFQHSSGTRFPMIHGFCDFLLDGESWGGILAQNDADYIRSIPLSVWQSEYGAQTGSTPVFLPQIDRAYDVWGKKPSEMKDHYVKKTRGMLAMLLVHDLGYVRYLCDLNEAALFDSTRNMFRLDGVRFVPYWSGESPVASFSDRVLASVYIKDGSALLGFANVSSTDLRGDVALDLRKMGFGNEPLRAMDPQSRESILMDDGIIKNISIRASDYLMVVVSSAER